MLINIVEYGGSFAFCISGASLAVARKMDIFGIFVMSVVAGFGGGFLRDIILGKTPPTVFNTPVYWLIALIATIIIFMIKKKNAFFEKSILIFDALGLAFFTVVGVKAGIASELLNYQCVLMGVITACFGGVIRDVIVNRVPYVFQKEVYGGFAMLGGVLYFLLLGIFSQVITDIIVIIFIFTCRIVSLLKNWHLPRA
ncbi:trimeric intracellular cation channel family protein [Spirobacillus cienkowskii]|uniref:trimeric intracellular cation channel family protein n=1 Tax=Spirobacillus cienkowskii TaxID=495820 RepID=UPI0030D62AD8